MPEQLPKPRTERFTRAPIIIALGGNAIIKEKQFGTIAEQFANTREAMKRLAQVLLRHDFNFVLTHGNGPQVGNMMIRVEATRDRAYAVPLGVAVAQTQGEMGYMIAQVLRNQFRRAGVKRQEVAAVLTQVLVDPNDPQLQNPTKPIGPFYQDEEQVQKLIARGEVVVQDAGRGWRRVVPSPMPLDIVEKHVIKSLLDLGVIVVACGGGGTPVYYKSDGRLEGLDGVVDKDLASAVLGAEVGANRLIIVTGVERIALDFGKPEQRWLEQLTRSEALAHLEDAQFPAGSMGPKVEAAVMFLDRGGREVVISDLEHLDAAIEGSFGTRIVPDKK